MPSENELLSTADVERAGPAAAREVLSWVRNYLGSPFAERRLSRRWVCPFIPGALERESLWMAVLPGIEDPDDVQRAMNHFRRIFLELDPREGSTVRYKTILVIFPSVPAERASSVIDGVQQRLKPSFVVDDHLMIGELHPRSMTEAVGFPGQGIFPNRSPVPLLAIRIIVVQDMPKFLRPMIRAGHEREDAIRTIQYERAYHQALLRWADEESLRQKRAIWEQQVKFATILLEELTRPGL